MTFIWPFPGLDFNQIKTFSLVYLGFVWRYCFNCDFVLTLTYILLFQEKNKWEFSLIVEKVTANHLQDYKFSVDNGLAEPVVKTATLEEGNRRDHHQTITNHRNHLHRHQPWSFNSYFLPPDNTVLLLFYVIIVIIVIGSGLVALLLSFHVSCHSVCPSC